MRAEPRRSRVTSIITVSSECCGLGLIQEAATSRNTNSALMPIQILMAISSTSVTAFPTVPELAGVVPGTGPPDTATVGGPL